MLYVSAESASGISVAYDPDGTILAAAKRKYAEARKDSAAEKLDSRVAATKTMGIAFTEDGDRMQMEVGHKLDLKGLWNLAPSIVVRPRFESKIEPEVYTDSDSDIVAERVSDPTQEAHIGQSPTPSIQAKPKTRTVSVPSIKTSSISVNADRAELENKLRAHFELKCQHRIKFISIGNEQGSWYLEFGSVTDRDTAFQQVDGTIFAWVKLKLICCTREKEEPIEEDTEKPQTTGPDDSDEEDVKHATLRQLILLRVKKRVTKDMRTQLEVNCYSQIKTEHQRMKASALSKEQNKKKDTTERIQREEERKLETKRKMSEMREADKKQRQERSRREQEQSTKHGSDRHELKERKQRKDKDRLSTISGGEDHTAGAPRVQDRPDDRRARKRKLVDKPNVNTAASPALPLLRIARSATTEPRVELHPRLQHMLSAADTLPAVPAP